MTNCPNCGAPLSTGKCEYCGTEFAKKHTVVYTVTDVCADFGRDIYGRFVRQKPKYLVKEYEEWSD